MLVSKIDHHHRRRRSACWRVTRPLLALFSLYSLYNSLSPRYIFFPLSDGVLFCHWCVCEMCGLIYDGAFADSQSGSNEGERKREWQRGGERERERVSEDSRGKWRDRRKLQHLQTDTSIWCKGLFRVLSLVFRRSFSSFLIADVQLLFVIDDLYNYQVSTFDHMWGIRLLF